MLLVLFGQGIFVVVALVDKLAALFAYLGFAPEMTDTWPA
jgi:hypothetical protein